MYQLKASVVSNYCIKSQIQNYYFKTYALKMPLAKGIKLGRFQSKPPENAQKSMILFLPNLIDCYKIPKNNNFPIPPNSFKKSIFVTMFKKIFLIPCNKI